MGALKTSILLAVFLVTSGLLHAQYFTTGSDPAGIRWKQIVTGQFRLVFPEEYASEGKRLASLLNEAGHHRDLRPASRKMKFPVLVHGRSVVSNALVSWAPARLELYPCPSRETYPQEWLEQLVIHELRHVAQMDKLNHSFTKGLSYILGQQAVSLVAGLYIPPWFMEGDAVIAETALSRTGRGRMPRFEAEIRALLISRGIVSYDKAVFGSFTEHLPDHYHLGYHMSAGAVKLFGPGIWDEAMHTVASSPFWPRAFSRGIKKSCGHRIDGLYSVVFRHLDSLLRIADSFTPLSQEMQLVPAGANSHSDYRFPAFMDDGSLFCMRSSLDRVAQFISFNPHQKEIILFTPGNVLDDAIVYRNGKIYWAEEVPGLRHENESFSVIKIYDVHERQLHQAGRRSRYFAPSPSPDGSRIATAETSSSGENYLVILDTRSGLPIHRTSLPDNIMFIRPLWNENGNNILATGLGKEGKTILETDVRTMKTRYLLPFTTTDISGAVYYRDMVFFIGGYNGVDNIIALDTASGKLWLVTDSRFGVRDISFNREMDSIVFAGYQYGGFRIARAAIRRNQWIPLERVKDGSFQLDTILSSDTAKVLFDHSGPWKEGIFEIRPYRKLAHLFNIHSWSPVYLDASNIDVKPGVQILSQNLTASSILSAGIYYEKPDCEWRYAADYTYAGMFPVVDIGYNDGLRSYRDSMNHRNTYREMIFNAGLRAPLNLTRNKYYRLAEPLVRLMTQQWSSTEESPDKLVTGSVKSIYYAFYGYNFLKYAVKDLFPRFGQWCYIQYRHSPFGDFNFGSVFSMEGGLFLPGIARHHSLRLHAGWQSRTAHRLQFDDLLENPRDYGNPGGRELAVIEAKYSFPLLYPDYSLPGITYIKRLKGSIFTQAFRSYSEKTDLTVYGADITADLHLFRFYAPVELGFRGSYIPAGNDLNFEFLYNIDFYAYGKNIRSKLLSSQRFRRLR